MAMRRQVQRLLACVCLGAFLTANTPTASEAARLLVVLLAGDDCLGAAHDMRPHPANSTAEGSTDGLVEVRSTACLGPAADPDGWDLCCSCGHGCPCCPKGPCEPKCPIPGGCANCNNAKVPCHVSARGIIYTVACLDAGVPEPTILYTPPSAGRLIRPPRS